MGGRRLFLTDDNGGAADDANDLRGEDAVLRVFAMGKNNSLGHLLKCLK